MNCKLCESKSVEINYHGVIRDGQVCKSTKEHVDVYKCKGCGVLWHESVEKDCKIYYESEKYRKKLEGTTKIEEFYRLHDPENLEKFKYTGTNIFRNNVVADIGCGGGAFLDFISGAAKQIIAVEPSVYYREILKGKGFEVFAYTNEANNMFKGKVDVLTSFDVIEHVEKPEEFLKDIYMLLSENGKAIVGTPTETPVLRGLLKKCFEEKLLFSVQHLWIFNESSLRYLAQKTGFKEISIRYYQRYGLGNLLAWLQERIPKGHIKYPFISETLDAVWKSECEKQKMSDYIVLYLRK